MQSQQLEFNTQEIQTLTQSVADLKKELVDEKNEHQVSLTEVEELRKTIEACPPSTYRTSRQMRQDDGVKENEQTSGKKERKRFTQRDSCLSSRPLNIVGEKVDDIELENQDLKRTVEILTRRIENNVEDFYKQKSDLEVVVREIERHYRDKQHSDESKIQLLESKS